MILLQKAMNMTHDNSWLVAIMYSVLAYLAPMGEIFCVLLTFVIIDLISGILVSRKKNVPCSSRKLRQSIIKLVSYVAVMLLIYAAERAFDIEWLGSYRFLGGFICFVEMISILENLAIITEKPIFLKVIKLIRGKAIEKHGKLTDDIFDEKTNEDV